MDEKYKFTVFTPTYNRAYILERTYQSLLRQNYKNFEWLVMDDGSNDLTKELFHEWIKEAKIKIIYLYQSNQGRFAALNNSLQYMSGDLIVPVDSDDYLLDNCLSRIAEVWDSLGEKRLKVSGIIANMQTNTGLLGTPFPNEVRVAPLFLLRDKYKVKGDKLQITRLDIMKKYKYPVFEGERFGGDCILYNLIDEELPEFLLNEMLAFREYLPDSITNNILIHHLSSPKGIMEYYLDRLKHEQYDKISLIKHCIGYIAYSRLNKVPFNMALARACHKCLVIFLFPCGLLYSWVLRYKKKVLDL